MLENKDREGLYKFLKPKFDLMHEENKNFTLLHIHLADGTSFLRVHEPKFYGDNIAKKRAMVRYVHKNHKTISGYEAGVYYTAYRLISPIFNKKGEYIGAAEIGLNANFLVDMIYDINKFYGLIFIKTTDFTLHSKADNILIDGYKLQSTIKKDKKSMVSRFLSKSSLKDKLCFSVDDKKYITHLITLKDFNNVESVKVVFFQDITTFGNSFNKFMYETYTIMFMILALLGFLINKKIISYQNEVQLLYNEQLAEIKENEKKYLTEKNNLSNILKAMEDGVYVVDQNFNIEYANQVLVDSFGEYKNKKCYQFFHDRDDICPWCKNDEVFSGKTVRWEWTSSKNLKTYDLIDTPIYNTDGTISKLEIFRDITKNRLLSDKLQDSKQQFEQFMEYMPANIMIKKRGVITYANSSSNNFFNKDNIIGKTIHDLVTPDKAIAIDTFEQEAFKNRVNEELIEIKSSDGENLVFRHMAFVIGDIQRERLGIVTIDITKEYKANKEVTKLLSAFERSDISVIITDLDGTIEYVNPKWCKVTGYTRDELIGKNPRIVKLDSNTKEIYSKMWKQISNGNVWNGDIENRAKNGTKFWEKSTIIPSFNAKGKIDGYIAFKTEITEKMLLKQEVLDKEEIMIAQSRHAAMGEMISMIAHQWRQPISVIAMDANNILADIELDMLDKDTLLETSQNIITQTKELSKTIDDFREFFKPNKDTEKISIKIILDDALSVIGKSLENSNIDIVLEIDEDIEIKTFRRELMQVLINIIKNAKEVFSEKDIENKEIKIKFFQTQDIISLKIEDNAGGIDEGIIDKIFHPYFTTKGEKNGTGLGLYMSKTIIEKHLKGSINAYNYKDGAVFDIELPVNLDDIQMGGGEIDA
jgi:PAS domain S-box-containing protein